MRVEIQNRILAICDSGTFAKVTYEAPSATAIKSATDFESPRVVINELQGKLTPAVGRSPRKRAFTNASWMFEAVLAFPCEVDITYFLDNELDLVTIRSENQIARVTGIDYSVQHPTRHGGGSGTKVVLTISLTNRR